MPASHQINDLLEQLRSHSVGAESTFFLQQAPADELISDLLETYPVLFQERSIGRKREVGMARALRFELSTERHTNSLFPLVQLVPLLRRCVFVSAYGGATSEITVTRSIRVRPARDAEHAVMVKMGSGIKLDRTPDGWVTKLIARRAVMLSDAFLQKRGWKFEVLQPFAAGRRT
jgi:hypothetical protein